MPPEKLTKKLINGTISDRQLKRLMSGKPFGRREVDGLNDMELLVAIIFLPRSDPIFDDGIDAMSGYLNDTVGPKMSDQLLHKLNGRMFKLYERSDDSNSLEIFHKVMLRYEFFRNPFAAQKHYQIANANNKYKDLDDFINSVEQPIDYFKFREIKRFYSAAVHDGIRYNTFHFFEANSNKLNDKSPLKGFEGDNLKTAILIKFKDILDGATNLTALHHAKKYIQTLPEYQILSQHRDIIGILGRLGGFKTASLKALEKMITEKESQLDAPTLKSN